MKNGPYELVMCPINYPGTKYRNKYVYEHHLVYWKHTGNLVPKTHVIHHKNGNKRDNRIENLELMKWNIHSSHHNPVKETNIKCKYCNKSITVKDHNYRFRSKNNKLGIFCSRSCGAKYQWKVQK